MATPKHNSATPADETLLDSMAADHVLYMSKRVQQLDAHGDANDRREYPDSSPPYETPDDSPEESPDAVAGAFESDSDSSNKNAAPIIMDLPLHVSAVDAPPEQADVEELIRPSSEEPEQTLAEEILSRQMADEVEFDAPVTFESEPSEEAEAPEFSFPDNAFAEEEIVDETPESPFPDDESIEIPVQPTVSAAPAPVRPRPVISAIRPPVRPSRFRSILIQGLIVLFSLTLVGMIAFCLGILKLKL